jgi:hypothetical protein
MLPFLKTTSDNPPSFVLDRYWNVVKSNAALLEIYRGVDPGLLNRPINALRLTLHPQGLAPKIVNLEEGACHALSRLERQASVSRDPTLDTLLEEMRGYVGKVQPPYTTEAVAAMLNVDSPVGVLSFLTTTMMFGAPNDLTVSELSIESFFPSDTETRARVDRLESSRLRAA